MGVAQAFFETHDRVAVGADAEMTRLDDAGMDRAYGKLVDVLAGDGQELGVALRTRSELALEDLDVVEATRAALG